MAHSIIADHLSKQYRIGELHRKTTFREALVNFATHPPWKDKPKYETICALKDVSFAVQQGEVVGIIGRNGAGKSTLLKLISKITYPSSGRVNVRGSVGTLLEVGTGFHEELTGRENVYLNGSILGMRKKEIDAKLDAIVAFAGVEKFIDTPIKRYSTGMRLRLGFAVAAHLNTDTLLVDEVLAVGDAQFQKQCLKTMSDLGKGGRTVLFVSHNMAAVENLCSRAIWIDDGEIRQDGVPADIIRAYLSAFAADNHRRFNLRHTDARSGSGEIRYTAIQFLAAHGGSETVVRSGDRLTVRLSYHSQKSILEPHFGIKIYSELGTMITHINTWMTGFEVGSLPPGENHIDLEIDFLNLMPGSYSVSLWIAGLGGLLYDLLEHSTILDVEPSNYYQSGRGIDKRWGLIFLPCRWKLHQVPGANQSTTYSP